MMNPVKDAKMLAEKAQKQILAERKKTLHATERPKNVAGANLKLGKAMKK